MAASSKIRRQQFPKLEQPVQGSYLLSPISYLILHIVFSI